MAKGSEEEHLSRIGPQKRLLNNFRACLGMAERNGLKGKGNKAAYGEPEGGGGATHKFIPSSSFSSLTFPVHRFADKRPRFCV